MLSLNAFWFLLIAILFVGFFVLEGFDFGVGTVANFLGKTETERRMAINTIGPFWDANEVWLITAGGAMFAAFPHWYATLFSGFYIPFVLMLLVLILRGVAFEFRGKVASARWKKTWDGALFIGSAVPPLLWGVALANLMTGIPIDENKEVVGGVLQLLHPFALLGGVLFLLLCIVHGLQFLALRTSGELQARARLATKKLAPAVLLLFTAFAVIGWWQTDIFTAHGAGWGVLPLLGLAALFAASVSSAFARNGWAFALTSLTIVLFTSSVFIGLFPRVLISTLGAANDLTIFNAASGEYTLKLMTYFSLTLLPFVLAYQGWSYYVFRKRITHKEDLEY